MSITKEDARRAFDLVHGLSWTFAKTQPQWPHWYVLKKDWPSATDFRWFLKLVRSHGYLDRWGHWSEHYLVLGSFKYWGWDEAGDAIINRSAPLMNSEVRRRGEIWLKRNKKCMGPYGRPVNCK